MAVSSAKSLILDLTWSGRSFMYARKSMGPRTEPCGRPEGLLKLISTSVEMEIASNVLG